jgi:two-component system, chemotaxis family, response regulator PixG
MRDRTAAFDPPSHRESWEPGLLKRRDGGADNRGEEAAMNEIARRILLIEDNHSLREEMVTILELEGYVVETAENGRVGIEWLEKNGCPDVVLCDLMMPEMDGYETVKAIRANPATAALPVLILTARDDDECAEKGLDLGADDYVTKPFKILELRASLDAAIEKRARARRMRAGIP